MRGSVPHWAAGLPAAWQGWWGRHRRARGCYDRSTLALFQRASLRAPADVAALCRWALFRRDLGRPLPLRWVARLRAGLALLPPALRRRALGLLAERRPSSLHGLPPDWLDDAASAQPGVRELTGGTGPLADMGARRAAFADWLAQRIAVGGLCVVGNAAGLAGRGLGAAIDAHAAVLRFNRWQGKGAAEADVGRRIDVWMVSPDLDEPVPPGLSWAIVSGPDPRFIQRRWTQAERLEAAGVPVLTVPLPVWRELVAVLQAPPSAGLLALAWVAAVAPAWRGVSVAGVGWGRDAQGRHHLVDRATQVGGRHRWGAEADCVARWRSSGLRDLGGLPDLGSERS